jgi:ATP-binding cassette subfamily C protein CydD
VRWWLVSLVGLGLLGSFASVALASAISIWISAADHRTKVDSIYIFWFAIGLTIKVLQPHVQERLSAEVSSSVKQEFRRELLSADFSKIDASAAEITVLATRGLDALDAYFGKFLPQFVYTLVVTPIVVLLYFSVDPLSAFILVATIPLIPLFMVFIGQATKLEQDRQLDALTKLGSHFAEVVRGISTLKLFGRIEHQLGVLNEIGDKLRMRTMKVLRISFLSGFALELAASLSVALIAVTIGFRLIDGLIPFSTAIFLLIMAPEAYLPIRMIGANYHASTEGIASASKVITVLEEKREPVDSKPLPAPGLELWRGPSGVGKSKALEALMQGENLSQVAWMPQQPGLFAGTVLENITGGEKVKTSDLSWAVEKAALQDISLSHALDDFGHGLSGGQAQRVSLARALYRFKSKNLNYLLLDEPTSSVDPEIASQIWNHLAKIATKNSVVIVTHQFEYSHLADRVVEIEG